MKRFTRIFLIINLVLVLILGSVFIALTFYKKELTQIVIDELRLKYGLTLLVEEVDVSFLTNWPHTSVQLKNVSVSSQLDQKKKGPFLKAGTLAVSFNMLKMLRKQFIVKYASLKDVDLNLVKYSDGTKNFEFKKSADTVQTESGLSLNLDKITLDNVKFSFVNEERGQNIGIDFKNYVIRLKNYQEGLGLKMEGDVLIKGLLFNPQAGEFLHNTKANLKLIASYIKEDKSICVQPPSYVEIEGHRYHLASIVDLSEIKRLSLIIESKGVSSERVASYLTPKIKRVLSNFKIKQSLDAKFLLVARLGAKEEPVIIADIVGKQCDLKIGNSDIPYSDLYFKGRVLSLHQNKKRGDMSRAKIVFGSIKGKIYDFPFTADLQILDLPNPYIDLLASIVVDGKNIKQKSTKNFVIKGTGLASVHYSGNARNLNKEKFLSDSMYLHTYLVFTNLSYRKTGSKDEYVFNGKATLDKQDLTFDNLGLKTRIGDFLLKGRSEQFLNYVLGINRVLKMDLTAQSKLIDLNSILSATKEEKETPVKAKQNNDFITKGTLDLKINLFAKKLFIRKIVAEDAQIRMEIKDKLINFTQVNLRTCDGEIVANGDIKDFNKITANVKIANVDATKLFEQFENFGQEAVKSENLKGRVFVEGGFSAELDKNNEFIGQSLKSDAKVKLKDGHLIEFEPVKNISNFAFKQRDFNDVTFSELNETIKVRGFEIKIDELEITSNVLNLYIVNGLYNMKGNSNINVLIPWSNLKKRGKDYVPKGSGQSAEDAKGLKLNYSGPPKKMKLNFGHKEQEKRFW